MSNTRTILTVREKFALEAMHALIINNETFRRSTTSYVASTAVEIADLTLRHLKEKSSE